MYVDVAQTLEYQETKKVFEVSNDKRCSNKLQQLDE